MYALTYERLTDTAKPPNKPKSETCAGYDIHADRVLGRNGKMFDSPMEMSKALTVAPGERVLVGTGLAMRFDVDATNSVGEVQIRPRSGNAWKHGVTVLNAPGTIDYEYEGEICVIIINHGSEVITIAHGDAIAQAVPSSVPIGDDLACEGVVVGALLSNMRGADGFGSSGTVGGDDE